MTALIPARFRGPLSVVSLITLNAAIVALTLYLAHSDPSAAIEPEYYEQAAAWDATARTRDASAALGWTAHLAVDPSQTLTVELLDRAGAPVTGAQVSVTAFASARAADRQALTLAESAPGRYTAPMRIPRRGQWEFRLRAVRAGDTFVWTTEQEVATGVLAACGSGTRDGRSP